jgi:hypothetical protein
MSSLAIGYLVIGVYVATVWVARMPLAGEGEPAWPWRMTLAAALGAIFFWPVALSFTAHGIALRVRRAVRKLVAFRRARRVRAAERANELRRVRMLHSSRSVW